MYFYCYVYVFLLLCMFCSVYSVFIVPTGTLRLPLLRLFRAFSSVVRQMPGCNSQWWGTVHTLPNEFDHSGFESQKAFQPKLLIVLFYVLFLCKCVLYYWHRVATQLQLINISYHIIYYTLPHIISYHIISYHTPYHIISHHIISYIISYITIMGHFILKCHAIWLNLGTEQPSDPWTTLNFVHCKLLFCLCCGDYVHFTFNELHKAQSSLRW
jgi:hypothetical protein